MQDDFSTQSRINLSMDFQGTSHEEFARRLNAACDANLDVPKLYFGRNTWIADRMREKHGVDVTAETVRKWLEGITAPRTERRVALADVLGVDHNWLLTGRGGPTPVSASKAYTPIGMAPRPAEPVSPEIAKYLAIGIVQVGGGEVTDIPRSGPVHLRASIRGAQYAFHAVLGQAADGDRWSFLVPDDAKDTFVLGILPVGPGRFRILDLDWDTVQELGAEVNGGREVTLGQDLVTGSHQWREILTFSRRL